MEYDSILDTTSVRAELKTRRYTKKIFSPTYPFISNGKNRPYYLIQL